MTRSRGSLGPLLGTMRWGVERAMIKGEGFELYTQTDVLICRLMPLKEVFII